MDVSAEKINVRKHFISEVSQDIRSFIAPLNNSLSITHFSYQKLYNNRKSIFLTTCPYISEVFFSKKIYKNNLIGNIESFNQGSFLYEQLNSSWIQILKDDLNSANGLIIIEKHINFVELYFFATQPKNYNINYFYLNHIDVFKNFCFYFKEEFSRLILKAENNKIVYPENSNDTTIISNRKIFENNIRKHVDLFIGSTSSQGSVERDKNFKKCNILNIIGNGAGCLTVREKECAYYLFLGMTMREIAHALKISPRTTEKHINSIKQKLGCYRKSEIIRKIFVNFL